LSDDDYEVNVCDVILFEWNRGAAGSTGSGAGDYDRMNVLSANAGES